MKSLAPTRTHSIHAIFSNPIRLTRLAALVAVVPIFVITFAAGPSAAGTLSHAFFAKAVALVTGTSAESAPSETRAARVDSAWSKGPEEVTPQVPDTTMGAERRGHTATSLSDGRVLIAGGENAAGQLSESEIFDPTSGTFSSGGSMTAARADHAAVRLADGRVLITGGRNGSGTLGTSEIFDPATGTFSSGPAMNVVRAGHSATLFA
ncbi:MAG TPA: kelch repeat-containing protein, partial [Pyrinomonadaceae bacterium]|nr:kelch repeat-containing protein [Pyrinomonadaceae bacterium]